MARVCVAAADYKIRCYGEDFLMVQNLQLDCSSEVKQACYTRGETPAHFHSRLQRGVQQPPSKTSPLIGQASTLSPTPRDSVCGNRRRQCSHRVAVMQFSSWVVSAPVLSEGAFVAADSFFFLFPLLSSAENGEKGCTTLNNCARRGWSCCNTDLCNE